MQQAMSNNLVDGNKRNLDGLIMFDASGRFQSLSPAAEAFLQYSQAELVGQSVKSVVFTKDHDKFDAYVALLKSHTPADLPSSVLVRLRRKDKTLFNVRVSAGIAAVGGFELFAGSFSLEADAQGVAGSHLSGGDSAEVQTVLSLSNYLLTETQHFLKLILNSSPDFIFVKDEAFRLVLANDAFLGLYPEEMRDGVIGTTTLESYDPEEAELFLLQDRIALEQGLSEVEEKILFPDGEYRVLLTKKMRFEDTDGTPYILGVGRDITSRKNAEHSLRESEERYELAVKGSSVGLWDWKVETHELYWSDRFKEIVGISDSEFESSYDDFAGRLHPEDKKRVENALKDHLAHKTPYDIEYRLKRVDGSYVWIHARGQALWDEDGNPTRMAGSADDITKSKAALDGIVRSNLELERFAFIASHDLQEPLRMVSNFTELIERRYADKLDDKGRMYIHYASSGAVRMQELVRSLLDYARLGHGTERYEHVNLNTVAETVADNLAELIHKTDAEVVWDELPDVVSDKMSLTSVFQNLIGNGLKYRKVDVVPVIHVTVQTKGEFWLFCVSDNGIGMNPKYTHQIFEPFKRLHRKEEYAGTGMGLSICRKSVESLGGSIWAESALGEGSKFYFTLPQVRDQYKGA